MDIVQVRSRNSSRFFPLTTEAMGVKIKVADRQIQIQLHYIITRLPNAKIQGFLSPTFLFHTYFLVYVFGHHFCAFLDPLFHAKSYQLRQYLEPKNQNEDLFGFLAN